MKRTLALILALLMLFSLISCSGTSTETETATIEENKTTEEKKDDKKKEEEKKEAVYMTVEDPLTWDDINAIPIAKQGMTSDELRQICIDYFNLAMTFRYIPDKSFNYKVTFFNLGRHVEEGQIYGGLPYVTQGTGTLYRTMDYYDPETGILKATAFSNNMKLFGNVCSGGAEFGWTRVVNSAKFRANWYMVQKHGFIPVGPFTYDTSIDVIGAEYGGTIEVKDIIDQNGQAVMFESYALTHKADGLKNSGHVRMLTEEPHVVKNADGTINGEESYLICSDQICYNIENPHKYLREQSDGSKYYIAGGNNIKYTFAELYKDGYLPFTFAEFLGLDPVEDGQVSMNHTGDTITTNQLCASTVTANYLMCDVYIIIQDAEGNTKLNFAKRMTDLTTKELNLALAPTYFTPYEDGTHTVEIKVQIGNGERLTAYKGTLVKG